MFGIDFETLIILAILAFILFGPEKLPEYAAKLGYYIAKLREASSDLTREYKASFPNLLEPPPAQAPHDARRRRIRLPAAAFGHPGAVRTTHLPPMRHPGGGGFPLLSQMRPTAAAPDRLEPRPDPGLLKISHEHRVLPVVPKNSLVAQASSLPHYAGKTPALPNISYFTDEVKAHEYLL